MQANRALVAIGISSIVIAMLGCNTHQSSKPKAQHFVSASAVEEQTTPIKLSDVRERGIQGLLGKKLGTIARVDGRVVKDEYNFKAAPDAWLIIERVDGVKLDTQARFELNPRYFNDPPAPKIGDTFSYMAYETGAYDGIVDGEFDYLESYAGTGYFFRLRLVVFADATAK